MPHYRLHPKIGPRIIDTAFHIQTVNNLHSRFESFMTPFCGPATKNLPGYAAWFITRLIGPPPMPATPLGRDCSLHEPTRNADTAKNLFFLTSWKAFPRANAAPSDAQVVRPRGPALGPHRGGFAPAGAAAPAGPGRQRPRMRGSSASRRPSPMKFTLSTVSEMKTPGQTTRAGYCSIQSRPS
jgi:hypothetical protein